jgi:hypothetical protein
MALIGQHQQTAFPDPQAGQSPISAGVVRGNDNAIRAQHNAHDADATIHIQTGTLAGRPAAGTANAVYMDENGRIYRDNGTAWEEIGYASLGAAQNTFTGNVVVEGNFAAEGLSIFDDDVDIDGNLTLTGNVSALGNLSAAAVSATVLAGNGAAITGILASSLTGNATLGNVSASAGFTQTGGRSVTQRATQSGGAVTVDAATGNWFRVLKTSGGAITLSNLTDGQAIIVEVLQDGTGGHSVSFTGVTSWDANNTAPTFTTTANRKDVFAFLRGGADTLGVVLGQNYASTS